MKTIQSNTRRIEDVLRSDRVRHCLNSPNDYCLNDPDASGLDDGTSIICTYTPSTCEYFKKKGLTQ
jgi:hypothetical protein